MRRFLTSVAIGALSLTTAAIAQSPAATATVERGYPAGALGLAAIQRQDWATAEAQLAAAAPEQRADPAALINLGEVYYRTGRPDLARQTWQAAFDSDVSHEVVLRSGRVMTTRDVAAAALRRVAAMAVAER